MGEGPRPSGRGGFKPSSVHLRADRRSGGRPLTVNLRSSLTVFKIGFAAESASGFAALATSTTTLPWHGLILLVSPAFSALGLLLLWLGRHEWNALHRSRVGHAGVAFAVSLVATALAAAPIAYFTIIGAAGPPGWVQLEFGAAIAIVFGMTFVTYALVASHLVGRPGAVAMGVGLAWALLLSALIGLAVSPELGPIVHSVASRSAPVDALLQPITLLDALLAFSYLAFFVAFADAHYRVATGRLPVPGGQAQPA